MYSGLLQLRVRQLKRQLERPGLVYAMLLIIAVAGIIIFLWTQYRDVSHAIGVAMLLAITILSIHASRKDQLFVRSQLPSPGLQLFAEYSVLSLPLTLPCLFTTQWYLFPILIAAFYLIAQLRLTRRQRTVFPHLSRLIPASAFELLSGVRKHYLILIPVYLAALATSAIALVPVFLLWLFTLSLLGCYQECESYDVLTVSSEAPGSFLRRKILLHYRLLAMLTLPVLLIQAITHPDYLWVVVVLPLIQLVLLALGISFKYSRYEPGRLLETGNILLTLIAGSTLVPFLLPLPALFAIRYFRSAKNHLKQYLL